MRATTPLCCVTAQSEMGRRRTMPSAPVETSRFVMRFQRHHTGRPAPMGRTLVTRTVDPRAASGAGRREDASDSGEAPLVDAILERGNRARETSFHVPGHKKGAGAHQRLKNLLGPTALQYDLTELEGLDFLAYPEGPIKQAQELASKTFGADKSWFLVNGTTGGIQAGIMATCSPGDHVILSRNCHQSAFSALVICGAVPIYVPSPIHAGYGIASTMTPSSLEGALSKAASSQQRVGAVLIVSPTYFGICADIKGLSEICHRYGLPLIVDEAHGAHLSQHPSFPPSALSQGADIVVQSTHKVLSSMTQSSMLHSQGSLICPDRVSQALQTLQSSSPSYVLMASLDAARLQVDEKSALAGAAEAAAFARKGVEGIEGVRLLGASGTWGTSEDANGMSVDPLRLTCDVSALGLSGSEAYQILEEKFGVVAELSTQQVVVFAFGSGSQMKDAEALVSAMKRMADTARRTEVSEISRSACVVDEDLCRMAEGLQLPVIEMAPREAFYHQKVRVPIEEAEERVSGELLCPYPPGIPVVHPGEVISGDALQLLRQVVASGGKVLGASDPALGSILVMKRPEDFGKEEYWGASSGAAGDDHGWLEDK